MFLIETKCVQLDKYFKNIDQLPSPQISIPNQTVICYYILDEIRESHFLSKCFYM